ncbi:hypothetical protein KHQ82_07685 [Mycoplasmatota bacterium]|nr:hypothetical protein KHQ82_07685 [Mycoplasmatota bacterium]
MSKIIVIILVLAGTIGLYILSYVLNKRTPVPDGITPIADCDACNTTSCTQHPKNDKSIKEDIQDFIKANKNDDVIL